MTKIFFLIASVVLLNACTQAPAPTVDRAPTARAERTPGPGEYLVKRGDTLYRIARENGMSYQDLASLNGIDNPSALKEGQILRLRPAGEQPAATVAAPIGSGSGVEVRPLGDAAAVAPTAGNSLRTEPKGGKLPYSDEAYARLNKLETPPVVADNKSAVQPTATLKSTTQETDGITWAWPTASPLKAPFSDPGNKGLEFAGKQGDPVQAAGDGKVLYVGDALAGYGKLVILKHSTNYLSVYAHNSKVLVKEGQAIRRGEKIAEMGKSGTDTVKLHFEIRKQGKPVDPAPFLPPR